MIEGRQDRESERKRIEREKKREKKDEEIGGNCLAINQSLDVLLMNRTAQTFIASLMRRASTRIHTSTTDIHTLTHTLGADASHAFE